MRLSKGSMMKRRTSMRCVDAREACSARRDLGRFLQKAAPPQFLTSLSLQHSCRMSRFFAETGPC